MQHRLGLAGGGLGERALEGAAQGRPDLLVRRNIHTERCSRGRPCRQSQVMSGLCPAARRLHGRMSYADEDEGATSELRRLISAADLTMVGD